MRITIHLDVASEQQQQALLDGLEYWRRLELLQDEQIRELGERYLAEALPMPTVVAPLAGEFFVPPDPSESAPTTATAVQPRSPSRLSRTLQSFVAEISVIWLLFLGVFLVIVSSGVLAASQWRNFSSQGQYGILLVYTLAFWGASQWVARQERLQLTARMLTIATLLLVPVNFWMMDGLEVGRTPSGFAIAAVASLTLSAITVTLLRHSIGLPLPPSPRWTAINALGLSWLHWGWSVPGWPLLGVYLGTIGTAINLTWQAGRSRHREHLAFPLLSSGAIALTFAILLLLGRAVLGAHIPIAQLGLAFGICGWLLAWLSQSAFSGPLWGRMGAFLLLLGWIVTVGERPPWQAIAISGLSVWLLGDRLHSHGRRWEVTALLLTTWQVNWLLWFVLPVSWRTGVLEALSRLAQAPVTADVLSSLGLLPGVIAAAGLAAALRKRQQDALATHAERLGVLLGIALFLPGVAVGLIRSVYLLLSTLTLAIVTWKRDRTGPILIYLTHGVGLATILSIIDTALPALSRHDWITVLLLLVAAEWGLGLIPPCPRWQESAWYLGFGLATLSYGLLLSLGQNGATWRWLIVPGLLTLVSHRSSYPRSHRAAWFTVAALGLQGPLLTSLPETMLTLGIGALLMLVHTRLLRQLSAAFITVGLVLGTLGTAVWECFGEQLTPGDGVLMGAIALGLLTILQHQLSQRSQPLSDLYSGGMKQWILLLSLVLLGCQTLNLLLSYLFSDAISWKWLVSAVVTGFALLYQNWFNPGNRGFWFLSWSLELVIASAIALQVPSLERLAIATLALAMLTQLGGDRWVRHTRQPYWSSWHAIPLVYAVLGVVLAHHQFTATTGLYTLAAALVSIGVGRRGDRPVFLMYLGLLGLTTAACELLIHQLLQVQGGHPGDGGVLLAALIAVFGAVYRCGGYWLIPALNIVPRRLHQIAHWHWVVALGLSWFAILLSISSDGFWLWFTLGLGLSAYGLLNGNAALPPSIALAHPRHLLWTWLGIGQAIALCAYTVQRLLPEDWLLAWGGAIATLMAFLLYQPPWQRWGWPASPWRRTALALPIASIVWTAPHIRLQGLLMAAAYYAWLARRTDRVRVSYISVLLLDWAVLKWLSDRTELEPIWLGVILGGSLLYIIQVDPALQESTQREQRHWLRTLAVSLISLTAFYQSEVVAGSTALGFAIATLIFAIGLVLLGLGQHIRAFLYVGTATFILRVMGFLWDFIATEPMLLWAIGIVLGLLFIWIAATFEARQSQVSTLVQYWATELEQWE